MRNFFNLSVRLTRHYLLLVVGALAIYFASLFAFKTGHFLTHNLVFVNRWLISVFCFSVVIFVFTMVRTRLVLGKFRITFALPWKADASLHLGVPEKLQIQKMAQQIATLLARCPARGIRVVEAGSCLLVSDAMRKGVAQRVSREFSEKFEARGLSLTVTDEGSRTAYFRGRIYSVVFNKRFSSCSTWGTLIFEVHTV